MREWKRKRNKENGGRIKRQEEKGIEIDTFAVAHSSVRNLTLAGKASHAPPPFEILPIFLD